MTLKQRDMNNDGSWCLNARCLRLKLQVHEACKINSRLKMKLMRVCWCQTFKSIQSQPDTHIFQILVAGTYWFYFSFLFLFSFYFLLIYDLILIDLIHFSSTFLHKIFKYILHHMYVLYNLFLHLIDIFFYFSLNSHFQFYFWSFLNILRSNFWGSLIHIFLDLS